MFNVLGEIHGQLETTVLCPASWDGLDERESAVP